MTGLTCNAKMGKKFRSHLKYWIKIHRTSVYVHKKYGLSVSFGPKRHVPEGYDCKGDERGNMFMGGILANHLPQV